MRRAVHDDVVRGPDAGHQADEAQERHRGRGTAPCRRCGLQASREPSSSAGPYDHPPAPPDLFSRPPAAGKDAEHWRRQACRLAAPAGNVSKTASNSPSKATTRTPTVSFEGGVVHVRASAEAETYRRAGRLVVNVRFNRGSPAPRGRLPPASPRVPTGDRPEVPPAARRVAASPSCARTRRGRWDRRRPRSVAPAS